MYIPNLPTDNYFKFLFFLGAFLIALGFYIIYNNNADYYAAAQVYANDLKTAYMENSVVNEVAKPLPIEAKEVLDNITKLLRAPDSIRNLPKNIKYHKQLVLQNDALSRKLDSVKQLAANTLPSNLKAEQSEDALNIIMEHNESKRYLAYSLAIIGCILMWSGNRWKSTQDKLDRISTSEYEKLFPKHETCESCSMPLENDRKYVKLYITKRNEYCTHCYNHKVDEFREDITLRDMELKVQARMEQLGFSPAEASTQTEKIKGLKRWVPHLHWIS